MQTPEDIFKAMNASRILVAILEKIGSVSVPTDTFLNANNADRQLSVSYNDETLSFEFSLSEPGQQEDYDLAND